MQFTTYHMDFLLLVSDAFVMGFIFSYLPVLAQTI